MLDDAPDAILTLDAQYRLVMCNPGAEKLFGYSKEEMIGRNIGELISGADRFVLECINHVNACCDTVTALHKWN